MPFSEEELDYIARLDAAADKELLRRELPSLREESLRTLEVATLLLQHCAAAGTATTFTNSCNIPLPSCSSISHLVHLFQKVCSAGGWTYVD